MIQQGTDALSRGEVSTGSMSSEKFLASLPLNKTAFERQKNLKDKVSSWLKGDEWEFTSTKDWFHKVFTKPKGAWVWCPPPALAKIAVEQMCEVKHAFPQSKHVFICPTLMEGQWGRMLGKLSDTKFTFKTKSCLWDLDMHESLTIAFVAPLLSRFPWKVARHPFLVKWEHELFKMQRQNTRVVRDHMLKFWVPRV